MSKEAKILIVIGAVVLIGGVLLAIFFNPQKSKPGKAVDPQSLIRETSHMTKSASAKVNLVEFGDYQCPGCAAAHPRLKELLNFYKDNNDVNFVFRNFPLSGHANAHIAAEAAEAAAKQGKFWEMHDMLYAKQEEWSTLPDPTEMFVSYAKSLGLNENDFRVALSQHLLSDVVDADYKDGQAVEVGGTPTFFINGVKLESANVPTVDELKAKIEEELKK